MGLAMALPAVVQAREWIKLEAPDFTVLSDANEKTVVSFATELTAFREATRHLFARPGIATPRSLIILHTRHREFVKYGERPDKDSKTNTFSFSTEVDGRAVTALARGSNWAETQRMMEEFETIWLLRRYGWALPTWMSQGSGGVVSTVEVKDHEIIVGEPSFRSRTLHNNQLLPWKRFFDVGRASPEYTGDKSPGVYHAQAYGLMHWLLLRDDEGAARFADLAGRVSSEPWIEAVEAVSGYPEKEWDRKIKAHMRGRTPERRFPFDEAAVQASFSISPLPEAELLALQADVAAAAGNTAEADLRYLRAAQMAPDSPVVMEAGARWMRRRGEVAQAIEKYRQAIAAGSENPGAYLASAQWRLSRSTGNVDRQGGGVPMVLEAAQKEVEQALALDPGYGEAYQLIGRLAVLDPEPDEAKLEILSRRIGPDFWGIQARYYRASLLDRLGRETEAKADLEWILGQSEVSETTRSNARNRLSSMRLAPLHEQVKAAMQAREYETAWEAIVAWEAAGVDPDDAGEIRALKERVSDVKAESEQRQLNRAMDRLNRMLKSRAFKEAQMEARRLAQRDVSEALRDAYQRVAAQVDEIATLQLMRAANKEEQWDEAIRLGEEFLPTAAEDSKFRSKIEAELAEAKAARP